MNESFFTDGLAAHSELVALAVLILGFVAARLAGIGVGFGLNVLDKRTARIATSDSSVFSPRLIGFVKAFVFWLVLIFSIALALQLLGVGGISAMLDVIIQFIPQALVGFVIVVSGHLLGLLVRNLVTQINDDLTTDSLGPRLLHGTFVVVALVMGLQQVNVDITFVTHLILILVAIAGGGLILAFALGARRHVANLMAHKELGRLSIGERIRIDDTEGMIVEVHGTGVDIATDEGIATIPAARFAEAIVLRMRGDKDDG